MDDIPLGSGFRFRIKFSAMESALLQFEERFKQFGVKAGYDLVILAADADSLENATRFFLDGYSFTTEEAAWAAGRKAFARLRVLNASLGLGLHLSPKEGTEVRMSEGLLDAMNKDGRRMVQATAGLNVLPNDPKVVEMSISAYWNRHQNTDYFFTSLDRLSDQDFLLDDASEIAVEVLAAAGREKSPRAKFLLTYMALEPMIEIRGKSTVALNAITNFIAIVQGEIRKHKGSPSEREWIALSSALSNLKSGSFTTSVKEWSSQQPPDIEIDKFSITELVNQSVEMRNVSAHQRSAAATKSGVGIDRLTRALRILVVHLIWARNRFRPVDLVEAGIDLTKCIESGVRMEFV